MVPLLKSGHICDNIPPYIAGTRAPGRPKFSSAAYPWTTLQAAFLKHWLPTINPPPPNDPCIVPLNIMFLVGVYWSVIAVPEVDASNGDGLNGSTFEGTGASALPRLYRDTDPP